MNGAPGRTRTADAGLRTASLCPLSYGGAGKWYRARRRGRNRGQVASVQEERPPSPRMRFEMIDPARPLAEAAAPLPDLVLYGRPGCHLCDDALRGVWRPRTDSNRRRRP
jgi:hypothetical protein